MTVLEQIAEKEDLLLQAMCKTDVVALDSLLADDLIFTDVSHIGLNKLRDQ